MALLAGGCSRTGYLAEPDPRFDGVWTLSALVVDGEPVDLGPGLVVLDIDTSTSALRVETGCRTLLGSFSFLDDGRAGFTLPGGTEPRCNGDAEAPIAALDQAFLDAITAVDSWGRADGELLTLSGPDDEVVLRQS